MAFPFLTGGGQKPQKPAHIMLGAHGEDIAAAYLLSIHYEIRGRNIRMGKDEIDILAWDPDDGVLVFAEVKTRTEETRNGFNPEMTATLRKRKALRRAARHWVMNHAFDGGYRIDLLCVENGQVSYHFKELSWS